MNGRTLGGTALISCLCGLGCGPGYAGLEIEPLSFSPAFNEISGRRIELVEGRVVHVQARPRSTSAKMYEDPEAVSLRPHHEEVLGVFEDNEPWHWFLVARAAGATCLAVVISGVEEECIAVRTSSP